MAKTTNVAVLLAGCGHLDGAEIHESVLTLLALAQRGATAVCIAPNATQLHVVSHVGGTVVEGVSRNVLEEASRISRVGKCLDLARADAKEFDALLLPGGYGVAKNHCTFALKGPDAAVREDVAAFVGAFFRAKKPVGAICISPALVALVLSRTKACATLTIGNDPGTAQAVERLGMRHRAVSSPREIVIDEQLKLITTPAYMFGDARIADVWTGIDRCVEEVLKRA